MQNHPAATAGLNRRVLIDIIAMLVIGLVVVVGYKLSPLLVPKADRHLTPAPDCNLHRGPCSVDVGSGRLELSISPRPIPLLEQITIDVRAIGIEPRRIDADLAGIGMNMGYNRPQLLPLNGTGSKGEVHYQATTTLPACITESMNWELALLVDTQTEFVLIPFRFSTPESRAGQ